MCVHSGIANGGVNKCDLCALLQEWTKCELADAAKAATPLGKAMLWSDKTALAQGREARRRAREPLVEPRVPALVMRSSFCDRMQRNEGGGGEERRRRAGAHRAARGAMAGRTAVT